ncbi:chondroadherin-like protein [Lampetra fluviatilis]
MVLVERSMIHIFMYSFAAFAVKHQTQVCPSSCQCDSLKRDVGCISKRLTSVPRGLPPRTRTLHLNGNSIAALSAHSFVRVPRLEDLQLRDCGVRDIGSGVFRGMSHLAALDLSNNDIQILHPGAFDGLTTLKTLLLHNNRLLEIKAGAFSSLQQLRLLNLTGNRLTYLPDGALRGLKWLENLRLSNNALSSLGDDVFAALSSLRRLDLDGNRLQFVPVEALAKLRRVVAMDLSENPLTFLGDSAFRTPALQRLRADDTALQNVAPGAFDASPGLLWLHLRRSQLKVVHPMTSLTRLRQLSLHGSPLQCDCYLRDFREWLRVNAANLSFSGSCATPAGVYLRPLTDLQPDQLKCESGQRSPRPGAPPLEPKGCPKRCNCRPEVHHVACKSRALTAVPGNIPGYTWLLDLQDNQVSVVPKKAFSTANNLFSLHLQNNRINDFAATFSSTPEIETLSLDKNKLAHVPTRCLQNAPNLKKLDLSYNPIKSIAPDAFAKGPRFLQHLWIGYTDLQKVHAQSLRDLSPTLRSLDLRHNKLRSLQLPYSSLTSLRVLHLHGNPWACDCSLMPLQRWLEIRRIRHGGKCAEPKSVRGKPLRSDSLARCDRHHKSNSARSTHPEGRRARRDI